MQIVDTGRKARFDKENPGYLASALRMAGAMTPRGRSMVDTRSRAGCRQERRSGWLYSLPCEERAGPWAPSMSTSV